MGSSETEPGEIVTTIRVFLPWSPGTNRCLRGRRSTPPPTPANRYSVIWWQWPSAR